MLWRKKERLYVPSDSAKTGDYFTCRNIHSAYSRFGALFAPHYYIAAANKVISLHSKIADSCLYIAIPGKPD